MNELLIRFEILNGGGRLGTIGSRRPCGERRSTKRLPEEEIRCQTRHIAVAASKLVKYGVRRRLRSMASQDRAYGCASSAKAKQLFAVGHLEARGYLSGQGFGDGCHHEPPGCCGEPSQNPGVALVELRDSSGYRIQATRTSCKHAPDTSASTSAVTGFSMVSKCRVVHKYRLP